MSKQVEITKFLSYKPRLSYQFNCWLVINKNALFKFAVQSVNVSNAECDASAAAVFLGNTYVTVPIINLASRKLEIVFEESDGMEVSKVLDNLMIGNGFYDPPKPIGIIIQEYDSRMNKIKNSVKYTCLLQSFTPPAFSRTGNPGIATVSATFQIMAQETYSAGGTGAGGGGGGPKKEEEKKAAEAKKKKEEEEEKEEEAPKDAWDGQSVKRGRFENKNYKNKLEFGGGKSAAKDLKIQSQIASMKRHELIDYFVEMGMIEIKDKGSGGVGEGGRNVYIQKLDNITSGEFLKKINVGYGTYIDRNQAERMGIADQWDKANTALLNALVSKLNADGAQVTLEDVKGWQNGQNRDAMVRILSEHNNIWKEGKISITGMQAGISNDKMDEILRKKITGEVTASVNLMYKRFNDEERKKLFEILSNMSGKAIYGYTHNIGYSGSKNGLNLNIWLVNNYDIVMSELKANNGFFRDEWVERFDTEEGVTALVKEGGKNKKNTWQYWNRLQRMTKDGLGADEKWVYDEANEKLQKERRKRQRIREGDNRHKY